MNECRTALRKFLEMWENKQNRSIGPQRVSADSMHRCHALKVSTLARFQGREAADDGHKQTTKSIKTVALVLNVRKNHFHQLSGLTYPA